MTSVSALVSFQLINQNQQRFVEMLNSPDPPAGGEGGGGAPAGGGGGGAAGQNYIQVTPAEREAIDRV